MGSLKLRTETKSGEQGVRARAGWRRLQMAACLAGVALLLSGCRLDMHIQPKYLPDWPSKFFADGRSNRPAVPGTVAREDLRIDELMYSGTENGVLSNQFPFPITRADLERGRERYNIYCSPCHDYTGTGHGMIVQRGFPQPPSYMLPRLRQAPVGHFYQVMTNGIGAMYSYSARVTPADRWRIAAYIRVLQLAGGATMQDVPQAARQKLTQAPAGQTPGQAQ
jgi:mono/diheme cytochrome c family protein